MLVFELLVGAISYLLIGSGTAAYAFNRFEEHKLGSPERPLSSHQNDCKNCMWQMTGVVWPLFWTIMFIRSISVLPYRRVLRRLEAKKLPEARLLKEGGNK